MSLVVVGSLAIDHVITSSGEQSNVMGGSACYFSCAASYFVPTSLVGVVGQDYPQEFLEILKQRQIDLEGLSVGKGESFRWKGMYSPDFSQATTLDLALNVFETFEPELPSSYTKQDHLFLANIDPELQDAVIDQMENPRLVILDSMNHWIAEKYDALCETLKKVDILILNDSEAKLLSEKSTLLSAAEQILKMGPEMVVIKRGEHGAFYLRGDDYFALPAYPVSQVVDTTGAGDTFAGGFVGHLSRSQNLTLKDYRLAMAYGACMSSFTIEHFGLNRLMTVSQEELEARLERLREITLF